ncbi:MAG TPA: hypothetical protein VHB45_13355 [Alloacidobacterium sp.]|nr:hypothetical protein [Alloacidobacterium sp.]
MAELRRNDDLYADRTDFPTGRQAETYDGTPELLNDPDNMNASATPRTQFTNAELRSQPGNVTSIDNNSSTTLFSPNDVDDLRARWNRVQTGFVDEPRRAVKEADELVGMVFDRLTSGFAEERANLEKRWDGGTDVSTEELRLALQKYRTFFSRLLAA